MLSLKKPLHPKLVLLVGFKILDWLYILIIPILKKKFKTKFVIICSKNAFDKYSEILDKQDRLMIVDDIVDDCTKGYNLDNKKEFKKAQENERKYKIGYLRDIVQQDRSISASFLSYAPNFIWDSKEYYSYSKLVRLTNGYVKFAQNLINKYNFDLALVWPNDGLCSALANLLEFKGVRVTYPYNSKYKGYAFWANGAFQNDKKLKKVFNEVKKFRLIKENELATPETGWPDTRKMDKTFSLRSLVLKVFISIFHRLEFFIIDLLKFNFRKSKKISLFSLISFQLNSWYLYKRIGKISIKNIETLSERPFLFYAIPLEPEFSVQARSKEFNDQNAIIKLLALNLPIGYDLIIKEHSDIGRRNIKFYKDLLKIPNIKMAHPSIRGIDLVRRARAVASMTGTVSLEATMYGKRAIEFSLHSSFSFLNNIVTIKEFSKIREKIFYALEELNNEQIIKIKKEGSQLLEAIKKSSFTAEDTPLFYKNKINFKDQEKRKAINLLLEDYRVFYGALK